MSVGICGRRSEFNEEIVEKLDTAIVQFEVGFGREFKFIAVEVERFDIEQSCGAGGDKHVVHGRDIDGIETVSETEN